MSIDPSAAIHATADIEADVSIAAGTRIWHRAQVRLGARIGAECIVGRDAFIDMEVVLGDRVKVQNGALLYRGASIGDDVFIGPGVIITNDRRPRAVTPAGHLARASDWTVTPTFIGTGASIGAGAIIVAGSDVGSYGMVGAGAVVTKPVPAHSVVVGNPARFLGWVCICGDRVPGHPHDGTELHHGTETGRELTCDGCGRRYRQRGDSLESAD